ncbi:MAG: hypothetical protein HKN12_08795 [Gemmatimonadetes bacterium]|nr:hypothetical protein [Gemmatimonadota bacterium]
MSGCEVVARFADGRVVGGHSWDFRPDRPWFQITQPRAAQAADRILIRDLKAVFFVRDLEGDPLHNEEKSFTGRKRVGRKTWVEFQDGECLAGWVESLNAEDHGFFLFPVDPFSNNEKVFVVRSAVAGVVHDEDAERAARRVVGAERRPSGIQRLSSRAWQDFLGGTGEGEGTGGADQPPRRKPERPPSGLFLQDF